MHFLADTRFPSWSRNAQMKLTFLLLCWLPDSQVAECVYSLFTDQFSKCIAFRFRCYINWILHIHVLLSWFCMGLSRWSVYSMSRLQELWWICFWLEKIENSREGRFVWPDVNMSLSPFPFSREFKWRHMSKRIHCVMDAVCPLDLVSAVSCR